MSVQAFISISFEAADPAEIEAVVAGLTGIPEGAIVGTQISQRGTSGVVDAGGGIVPPPAPDAVE